MSKTKNEPRQLNNNYIVSSRCYYGERGLYKLEVIVKNSFTPIIGEVVEFENHFFITTLIDRNYQRLIYDENECAIKRKYQDTITLIKTT